MIEVYKPLWNGNKQRCVGLADYRIALEGNIIEVNITYKTKGEGLRLYPEPFYIRKVDIVRYPPENAKGTKVYVVPICDLSTSPDMSKKYVQYDIECPDCKQKMRQNLNGLQVTYKCDKCSKVSAIEWELDKPHLTEVSVVPSKPEARKTSKYIPAFETKVANTDKQGNLI